MNSKITLKIPLNFPYSDLDLMCTFHRFYRVNKEKMKKVEQELIDIVSQEKQEINKQVAQKNGVSIENLINSPNYEILLEEYTEVVLKKFREKIGTELSLCEKQSWAVFAAAAGFFANVSIF